jgi:hypothetical protein
MPASLTHVIDQLRNVLRDLERLAAPRAIDQALLDTLAEEELSTNQLALRVRRRRSTVLAMLRTMEKAGEVRRDGHLWRLVR